MAARSTDDGATMVSVTRTVSRGARILTRPALNRGLHPASSRTAPCGMSSGMNRTDRPQGATATHTSDRRSPSITIPSPPCAMGRRSRSALSGGVGTGMYLQTLLSTMFTR